jgi:hypothetical protein
MKDRLFTINGLYLPVSRVGEFSMGVGVYRYKEGGDVGSTGSKQFPVGAVQAAAGGA